MTHVRAARDSRSFSVMPLSVTARFCTAISFVTLLTVFVSSCVLASPGLAASGVINNNGVDVSDVWIRPGSPGSSGSAGSGSTSTASRWLGPYRPTIPVSLRRAYCVALIRTPTFCGPAAPTPVVRPVAPVPAIPTLTLRDLSHVEPASPTLTTQPAGWSIVGLPTNLIAHISTHVVSTVVLGRSVDVEFTPVRFDWAFGDGTAVATSGGGASWEQLGLPEFSATPTSHRYTSGASVRPVVTVTYSVRYRWVGRDWISVEGTLNRGASAPILFLQNADTVLVTSPCAASSPAVGCAGF